MKESFNHNAMETIMSDEKQRKDTKLDENVSTSCVKSSLLPSSNTRTTSHSPQQSRRRNLKHHKQKPIVRNMDKDKRERRKNKSKAEQMLFPPR